MKSVVRRGNKVLVLCSRHKVNSEDLIDHIDTIGCSICNPEKLQDGLERLLNRWVSRCLALEERHGEGKCVPSFEQSHSSMNSDVMR